MARTSSKKSAVPATRKARRRVVRARKSEFEFKNVHAEGPLFSAELLAAIAGGDASIPGVRAEDYHLMPGERLGERVSEAWAKLRRVWDLFQQKRAALPDGDYGTSLTRSQWLTYLLKALDYTNVAYNTRGEVLNEKTYRLSHTTTEPVALYLVSFRQDLDEKDAENPAGAKRSPHAMMQEYLNLSGRYLWGFLTNGLRFRIMRENSSYVHSSYVEFDLETIMETDSYSEFYLFYMLAHQSRVERRRATLPGDAIADDEGEEGDVSAETQTETECWLETWRGVALQNGVRALDGLWAGVRDALETLGAGFLERPENRIRELINARSLTKQGYYHDLLRLVYRIVFLLIAEDRDLFFTPSTTKTTREVYEKYYSISRIRRTSRRLRGSRHCDMWEQLKRTFEWCRSGEERVGIPAFGSSLFNERTIFDDCRLSNTALLAAIRSLTHTTKNDVLQPIDYKHLGVEELGSVYETLLEMRPEFYADGFKLDVVAGNERKTTGSYYTPPDLVNSLLDTALDPVVDAALSSAGDHDAQERALLNLKVCDPACGSGHFLIGAARRLGRRLAQLRSGDLEPAPVVTHKAVRDVVAHCLYGVDLNPMAVELCKVSLWIESMEPGKGLMFLDHRLKCGNSLLGATPELLAKGVPDEAFLPLEGDDKNTCSELKKKNQKERAGQRSFSSAFHTGTKEAAGNMIDWLDECCRKMRELDALPNDDADAYAAREQFYTKSMQSLEFRAPKSAADIWCCAFVWPKKDEQGTTQLTHYYFDRCRREGDGYLTDFQRNAIRAVVDDYQFFHWHLEFPDVFGYGSAASVGGTGRRGFDVVVGNPPWERVKLQEKEWFAQRDEEIANASNKAARTRLIKRLQETNPTLYDEFTRAQRKAEATSQIIRCSGRFPLCGCGDVNTYAVFAELNRQLVNAAGRVGNIVPSGIATDATTKAFFQSLIAKKALRSLYDFENRKKLFPAVHSRMKFTLLTTSGSPVAGGAELAFFNLSVADIKEPGRAFQLEPEEIAMVNPNTGTCPIFRSVRDAELTKAVYRRVPVLIREARDKSPEVNPWGVSFTAMFHMSGDSELFRTRDELEERGFALHGARFRNDAGEEYWPLYEAKMVHHFNHRFGDYNDLPEGSKSTQLPEVAIKRLMDKDYVVMPRYWVPANEVRNKVPEGTSFIIGWRKITNATNARTVVSGLTDIVGYGDSYQCVLFNKDKKRAKTAYMFYSDLTSLAHDYIARQKQCGTNMNFFLFAQMAQVKPDVYDVFQPAFNGALTDFIKPRVLELTYTASDLRGFAESVGDRGEPFVWNDERRFLLRCELDALYFGLYLGWGEWSVAKEYPESPEQLARLREFFPTPVDALDHIMGTFPIVKRKELADEVKLALADRVLAQHGVTRGELFPTHAVVRAMYAEMVAAMRGGYPWKSWLDPLPADDSLRFPA